MANMNLPTIILFVGHTFRSAAKEATEEDQVLWGVDLNFVHNSHLHSTAQEGGRGVKCGGTSLAGNLENVPMLDTFDISVRHDAFSPSTPEPCIGG